MIAEMRIVRGWCFTASDWVTDEAALQLHAVPRMFVGLWPVVSCIT